MPTFDTKPLLDALSVPLGELIASVGRGVAEAQEELDAASIAALQRVYSANTGLLHELQRVGYRPTWYQIPEAEAEIQIALTMSGTQESGTGTSAGAKTIPKLYAAPIDAGYSSRFNFSLQAGSRLKFRVVPVPPSTSADAMRAAPALVGLTVAEARVRLGAAGVPSEFPQGAEDSALVRSQTPGPGVLLAPGDSVRVVAS